MRDSQNRVPNQFMPRNTKKLHSRLCDGNGKYMMPGVFTLDAGVHSHFTWSTFTFHVERIHIPCFRPSYSAVNLHFTLSRLGNRIAYGHLRYKCKSQAVVFIYKHSFKKIFASFLCSITNWVSISNVGLYKNHQVSQNCIRLK